MENQAIEIYKQDVDKVDISEFFIGNIGESGKFFKIISDAQEEFPPIKPDAHNKYYNSTYASLPNVLKSIKPILRKYDLVVIQPPMSGNQLMTVIMHHPTGQYIYSKMDINPINDNPQALKSAITISRRTMIVSMLNLIVEADDDDGNDSSIEQGDHSENIGNYKYDRTGSNGKSKNTFPTKWLNKEDRQTGEMTSEWKEVTEKLHSDPTYIERLKDDYKISNKNFSELETMVLMTQNINNDDLPF